MATNLYLESLTLTNFKNYEMQTVQFSPYLNCIVGENGMGKTNLLDAIHLLCLGKSHFVPTDQNLVLMGMDFFRLQAKFLRLEKVEEVVVKYKLRGKKNFECNKSPYKRLSDHIGLLPLVIIAPDDAQLIMEGSEERRRFLDLSLVQIDPLYLQHLMQYSKVLEQRNALLKSVEPPQQVNMDLLETYDQQLMLPAAYIFEKRTELVKALEPIFQEYYAAISGAKETVSLRYSSSLQNAAFSSLLLEARQKDFILQRSTKGS